MPRNKRFVEAEKKKERWVVLPPEEGYPFPDIGFRLMVQVEVKNKKKWICVLIGHRNVMQQAAAANNKAEFESLNPPVPLLEEKPAAAINH